MINARHYEILTNKIEVEIGNIQQDLNKALDTVTYCNAKLEGLRRVRDFIISSAENTEKDLQK